MSRRLHQLKRSLENKLESLGALDGEILTLTPPENIEDQADEVRERVFLTLSRLDVALTPPRPAAIPRAVEAPRREEPRRLVTGTTDGDR